MVNRQKVQKILAEIGYDPKQFSLDGFIAQVETFRARRMVIVPYAFTPGVSGLWFPGRLMDFVVYREDAGPWYRMHIILHEIAHMLLQHPLHRVDTLLTPELAALLPKPLEGHLLARSVDRLYNDIEREAELFVHLLQKPLVYAERMKYLTTGLTTIPELEPFVYGLPFEDPRWKDRD